MDLLTNDGMLKILGREVEKLLAWIDFGSLNDVLNAAKGENDGRDAT